MDALQFTSGQNHQLLFVENPIIFSFMFNKMENSITWEKFHSVEDDKFWELKPISESGDVVIPGSWIGEVKEKESILLMVLNMKEKYTSQKCYTQVPRN